ncbi:MAG: hypothetical protein WAT74_04405 [Flavobacteriales bacterium]
MTISWTIPVESARCDEASLNALAAELMPLFGMDTSECRVRNEVIEASPDSLRLNRMVTSFRVAVYDMVVMPNAQRSIVIVRFRLYKGLAVAVGSWFIAGFMGGSMLRWESMFLPMAALLMFNGLAFLVIQASKRETVEVVKRWGTNKLS